MHSSAVSVMRRGGVGQYDVSIVDIFPNEVRFTDKDNQGNHGSGDSYSIIVIGY